MPFYRATIELQVDGNNVDELYDVLDYIRVHIDGTSIDSVAPYHDNPPDYPDAEWYADNNPVSPANRANPE